MVDNDGTTAATTATGTYPTLILLHLYRSIHAPGLDGAKKSGASLSEDNGKGDGVERNYGRSPAGNDAEVSR